MSTEITWFMLLSARSISFYVHKLHLSYYLTNPVSAYPGSREAALKRGCRILRTYVSHAFLRCSRSLKPRYLPYLNLREL
ncbi:hypothetical protein EDB80DRAFT_22371 [Ilyonectria destructans]|nr:hypothetical protein EDB80DRAFT_22371 [Ilyonectria destructans]